MPRILFLTAGNVSGQHSLRVGREARAVRAAIATIDRDYADLRVEADVGTDEIVEIVLSMMPEIIHFSGHSKPGHARLDNGSLSAEVISRIVLQVPDIWCVVFNSCYSDSIANQLVKYGVPAVVGMTDAIDDDAAIAFSRFFYRALAERPDIERAVSQSNVNLETTYPKQKSKPLVRIGNRGTLAERSLRFARPELRARFCVNSDGSPQLWKDNDGTVFVTFDIFLEHAPASACSVIYRLDESYNDGANSPATGQFREVTGANDKFYVRRIDSEDDYTIEAYIRWNDGRVQMIKRFVTDALRAYYNSLSPEAAAAQKVDRKTIDNAIVGLENENLQLLRRVSRQTATSLKKKRAS